MEALIVFCNMLSHVGLRLYVVLAVQDRVLLCIRSGMGFSCWSDRVRVGFLGATGATAAPKWQRQLGLLQMFPAWP